MAFNALVEPPLEPAVSSNQSKESKTIGDTMAKSSKKLVTLLTKPTKRVISLEQSCRPQSHKRNQDDLNQDDPSWISNAFYAQDTWENARPEEYDPVIMRDVLRPRKEVPGPSTCDLGPLISKIKFREPETFINNDMLYMLYEPTKYTPFTKKLVVFDDYPEKFLEEGVLAKKYVKNNISDKRFKRYYFLRISHLEENTKGFCKLRQLKRKDKDQVFSSSKIRGYIEVKIDFNYRHGFVDYFVERYNNQQYIFTEVDYPNLHPHGIEDIYKRRRDCINKKGVDQDIIVSLKIFMRSTIVVVHIEDFHMWIESYQRKINLTPPEGKQMDLL
ncbi:hypothetical protein Tco_1410164 [Tanacetum coccineum]